MIADRASRRMPAAVPWRTLLAWFLSGAERQGDEAKRRRRDVRTAILDSPFAAYVAGIGVGLAAGALALALAMAML